MSCDLWNGDVGKLEKGNEQRAQIGPLTHPPTHFLSTEPTITVIAALASSRVFLGRKRKPRPRVNYDRIAGASPVKDENSDTSRLPTVR